MKTIEAEVMEDKSVRDTKGRRIIAEARRAELLALYEESGLTQKAFARREGVNFHTFVSWLAKRRLGDAADKACEGVEQAPAKFVELSAPAAVLGGRLEVVLCDGRTVRGSDAATLAALVRLLEA